MDSFDYRLDNSGKIYPTVHSRRCTTMFRVAVLLKEPVDAGVLQAALDGMMERCPYYRVQLRRGLFWYYLEPSDVRPLVEAESRYPCLYIPYQKRGVLPFRVLAYGGRIAFEPSHLLTDGMGALRFLKSLVYEYGRLQGWEFPGREDAGEAGGLLRVGDRWDPEEFEDGYLRYNRPEAPRQRGAERTFQLPGRRLKLPRYDVVEGVLPGGELKELAGRYGVTVGVFLGALLMDVLLRIQEAEAEVREERRLTRVKRQPVRITVPVDLRRIFPSQTMRNFILTVDPMIDPRLGDFSFEDILGKFHHFMKYEVDDRMMRRQMARNVAGESRPLIRVVPLFIKKPAMRRLYYSLGSRNYTVSFSNLGRVSFPGGLEEFVRGVEFVPPRIEKALGVTALAYGGETHVFFGRTVEDPEVERRFLSRLREMGLPVTVKTNLFDKEG